MGICGLFYTFASRKSVIWICEKRVGIRKSSRFKSVTHFDFLTGNTLIFQKNLEIVTFTERYSVADVIVEEMRLNTANGYARAGMEDEAMRLYGEVRRNLKRAGSVGRLMRHKHFLLYYNALAVLATIRQENELEQWVKELEALVEQWIAKDASLAYYRCYPWAFRIDVLSVEEFADEHLLVGAEACWKQTMGMIDCISDRFACLQAAHGLTKSLARYYVDRFSVEGLSIKERLAYAGKAQNYLDVEEKLCQKLMV